MKLFNFVESLEDDNTIFEVCHNCVEKITYFGKGVYNSQSVSLIACAVYTFCWKCNGDTGLYHSNASFE